MLDRVPPVSAKAYSYLRFSSPEQAKGASRARQIEAAVAWADEHGLVLDEQLRDEGVSAFRGRNREATSALGGFLGRVDRGEVPVGSYLLVESFDRLSRQEVVDALELFLSLTRKGITVVTLADGCVYNRESLRRDQTQLIISIIIMTRAFEESATKSRRVGDAWSRKRVAARERKQAMTATCPGWMRLVGGPRTGHYELIEDRAAIVREIFDAVIAGDGRRTIVKRLNAAKVDTWGSGGKKGVCWHDSYVQKILSSPSTFGRYENGDEQIDGYFPAVIGEETFWRARAATAGRLQGQGRPTRRFNNLLHGLARCPSCDGTMAFIDKGKKGRPRLQCSRSLNGSGCAESEYVPYAGIDGLVVHAFAHFSDGAVFALEEEARASATRVAALHSERDELAARRARLVELAEGGEPIPEIRQRLDGLVARGDALSREIYDLEAFARNEADVMDDIEERLDVVGAMVDATDPLERYRGRSTINARLRLFLDKIVVGAGPELEYHFKPKYRDIDAYMYSELHSAVTLGDAQIGVATSPSTDADFE